MPDHGPPGRSSSKANQTTYSSDENDSGDGGHILGTGRRGIAPRRSSPNDVHERGRRSPSRSTSNNDHPLQSSNARGPSWELPNLPDSRTDNDILPPGSRRSPSPVLRLIEGRLVRLPSFLVEHIRDESDSYDPHTVLYDPQGWMLHDDKFDEILKSMPTYKSNPSPDSPTSDNNRIIIRPSGSSGQRPVVSGYRMARAGMAD